MKRLQYVIDGCDEVEGRYEGMLGRNYDGGGDEQLLVAEGI